MDLLEYLDEKTRRAMLKRSYQRQAYLRRKARQQQEYFAKLNERANALREECYALQKQIDAKSDYPSS